MWLAFYLKVERFVVVGARIWFVRGEFGSWLKMEIVSHACLASVCVCVHLYPTRLVVQDEKH